jgi:RecA/RadA recombinase
MARIKRFLEEPTGFIINKHINKELYMIIPTGSLSLDRLLGGGIRTGLLTDIYGPSGTGKSQLCFSLCVNSAKYLKQKEMIMFIDTVGTFRPERISEIAKQERNNEILDKIIFIRAFSTYDQIKSIRKIYDVKPLLIIVDSATSLFSTEYSGASRHLVLMNHLHELSFAAINFDCAVVITNMVRNVPIVRRITDQDDNNNNKVMIKTTTTTSNSYQQREFMGTSVSIYSHIKLRLEIDNSEKSIVRASLMQPTRRGHVSFRIISRGFSDQIK